MVMEVQPDGGGSDDEDEEDESPSPSSSPVRPPVVQAQIKPDLLLTGAGDHGEDVSMDITFVNCINSHNVGANDKVQLKEVSPRLLGKVREKERKYKETAARMNQTFEAVVIAHSGQWSSGAIRMMELGVRKYAERQGYPVGVVRGWWMLALCMEHAKGTAGMVLHAAAAMAENRKGQRHDAAAGRLNSCFRADVANAREPPQFQRPLLEEELCAGRAASGGGGGSS